MKRPTLPKNEGFWIQVARRPDLTETFLKRGNPEQVRNLRKAMKYLRWCRIQNRKQITEEVKSCTITK